MIAFEEITYRFGAALASLAMGAAFAFGAAPAPGGVWATDTSTVGATGLEMRYFDQGEDYSGPVRSTLIRKLGASGAPHGVALYIHGFNDYFFQGELADSFVANGYDFYAIDLRKYGRSLLPGQKPAQARSLDEYFPDIDSALLSIGRRPVVMVAHSTGGLIACYYLKKMEQRADTLLSRRIDRLILNSPFLDWNLGKLECFVPVVSFIGLIFPGIPVSQGGGAYGESLLEEHHGQWHYNIDWKRPASMDVDLGWVRAIDRAQRFVRSPKWPINIPVLLLHSARSIGGKVWTPAHNAADAVLDVSDISRIGRELGPHVTEATVEGGLHDLLLSTDSVRAALYSYIFNWLSRHE